MKYNPVLKSDPKQTNKFLQIGCHMGSLETLDIQDEFSNGWDQMECEHYFQEPYNFCSWE